MNCRRMSGDDMNNAKIQIGEFEIEKSLHIQSELVRDTSVSYGELADLQGKTAEDLWQELGNVPIDDNDNIVEDFYSFPKGTCRFDIWSWFEDVFDLSVAINLMNLTEGEY